MSFSNDTPLIFKPKRAVIVSKLSMLEYELRRFKKDAPHLAGIDDGRFLKELGKRHSNVEDLRKRHQQQHDYVNMICNELSYEIKDFSAHEIDYRVVDRQTYTEEIIAWSDLIISAGGDGTFLTAARKVRSNVPVIGINTDPIGQTGFSSEGHLCLTGKLNRPPDEVIRQFLYNKFKWTYRQRIRVTCLEHGSTSASSSSEHGENNLLTVDNAYDSDGTGSRRTRTITDSLTAEQLKFNSDDDSEDDSKVALDRPPYLALNEVFIGESHAARVSYYDVQIDDGPFIKQKSSGMIVCTGTGSTSWHYNINQLTEYNLKEITDVAQTMGFKFVSNANSRQVDDKTVNEICRRFNKRLVFDPEEKKMAFSIRDPLFNATFPKTISRGFVNRIRLKSRCTHAHLILDGSTSLSFNRGAEVVLDINPDDALRTVTLL